MSDEKGFGCDFEDVSITSEDHPERKVVGACPLCGSDVYEYSWGWGCSKGKDNCEFSISRTICGHTFTEGEISDLLIKGETGAITDFVGKTGKQFAAKVTYRDKFAFDFINDKKEDQ